MKIHSKILRFFLLPTLCLIICRLAYYLNFKQAFEIFTCENGGWRLFMLLLEIVFYIGLYIYFKKKDNDYQNTIEHTQQFCFNYRDGKNKKKEVIELVDTYIGSETNKHNFTVTKYPNKITISL